jgi:hypothetical protein
MPTPLELPIELLLDILCYFDVGTILSLRQLSKGWKLFVDGEDVSRYFIEAKPFTFRGTSLRKQPEVLKRHQDDEYQPTMNHLSSRFRRLYSEGPAFVWSLPYYPKEYKFCYDNNLLALQQRRGSGVEIRDARSQTVLDEIGFCDDLKGTTSTQNRREVLGMRMRDDVLLISVFEYRRGLEHLGDDGINHLLFYRLTRTGHHLLRNLRFQLNHKCASLTFGLCDFTGTLAVIGTFFDSQKPYIVTVWNLNEGQRKSTLVRWHSDVRAVYVSDDNEWSVLYSERMTRNTLGVPPSDLYWIKTFSGNGIIRKEIVFNLLSFPSDLVDHNPWRSKDSHVTFGLARGSGHWIVLWRELWGIGNLRLFVFDKFGRPILRRLIDSCFFPASQTYMNIASGYGIGIEKPTFLNLNMKLFYISFRELGKLKSSGSIVDRGDDARWRAPSAGLRMIPGDGKIFENRLTCKACARWHCRKEHYNYNAEFNGYGDADGFVCRVGDTLRIYRFDSCQALDPVKL